MRWYLITVNFYEASERLSADGGDAIGVKEQSLLTGASAVPYKAGLLPEVLLFQLPGLYEGSQTWLQQCPAALLWHQQLPSSCSSTPSSAIAGWL